jgi:outer membrane protein assembly factor BamB
MNSRVQKMERKIVRQLGFACLQYSEGGGDIGAGPWQPKKNGRQSFKSGGMMTMPASNAVMTWTLLSALMLTIPLGGGLNASAGESADAGASLGDANFRPSPQHAVGWRGDGTGRFPGAKPPVKWSRNGADGKTENIIWQTEMPSSSPSSAIVAGDRVFVTASHYDLICIDKSTGKILWVRTASPYDAASAEDRAKDPATFKELDALAAERDKMNEKIPTLDAAPVAPVMTSNGKIAVPLVPTSPVVALGAEKAKVQKQMDKLIRKIDPARFAATEAGDYGYGSATPASDGAMVYAVNGMGVISCWDFNGVRKWIVYEHGSAQHHGNHSSPVVVGDNLIAYLSVYKAFNRMTGAVVWTQNENVGNRLPYGSPTPLRIGADNYVVSCLGSIFRAEDGAMAVPSNLNVMSSPAVGDGKVCLVEGRPSTENKGQPVLWYEIPADITASLSKPHEPPIIRATYPWADVSKKEWGGPGNMTDNNSQPETMASPLIYDGLVYVTTSKGILIVIDLKKNELVYSKLLDIGLDWTKADRPFGCGLNASPAMAGGKIFITGHGTFLIIEPGREYKEIARNKIDVITDRTGWYLTQQGTMSSPFFDGDRIYYRAERFVYCIGDTAAK